MNLTEPLAGLTTPVQAAVLRVLARAATGFSGRQVHRLANTSSISSVHRALTTLVGVGLVTANHQPPSIVYRANRKHVLWPAVESGLAARDRFFESLREFCDEELPKELSLTIVLFGSVARRESSAESDVDLFLVYPDEIDPDAEADFSYQIAGEVELLSGNAAQIYAINQSELVRRHGDADPLLSNVLRDGILLHGEPLSALSVKTA
jgi:predicted nucleotidyltransferase